MDAFCFPRNVHVKPISIHSAPYRDDIVYGRPPSSRHTQDLMSYCALIDASRPYVPYATLTRVGKKMCT